jgi:hypothetical protein
MVDRCASSCGVRGPLKRTSAAADEHFDGAFGPQVRLHDVQQPLGGVDVHEQRCQAAHHLRLRIQRLHA